MFAEGATEVDSKHLKYRMKCMNERPIPHRKCVLKVAICGRTGSGKSSLAVRARFNSLPYDPFFIQGTVRENLDPLGVATDECLVQALQSVRLWDFYKSRGGLDEDMNEGTLSYGQRQLFCLVRAVINLSSVLIMDEVGGSVDADTDAFVEEGPPRELLERLGSLFKALYDSMWTEER
ncbi:hypothetical protein N7449_004256 [Penicillium cf. viridicatum]|uniref:ABC transporter domain-containing protein n=1 Tax=Penicillium cf. viridicatum TaxID=2972119 RepID=A0A9W9MJ82_9EURO|nr:hypothetical protein N7449_004256 [Penicillium cf. viridicatum]